MDPAVVILLIALLAIAAQAAWFGFVSPPRVLAWLAQAGFVTTTFLLIPVTLYVLHNQATSVDRLEAFGILPYPAIKHASGIANGEGENPVWVFDVSDEPHQILEFYRAAMSETPWVISEDNYLYLRYRNAGQILTIAGRQQVGASSLIITVTTSHEQKSGKKSVE